MEVQSFDNLVNATTVELPEIPTPPETEVTLPAGYWDFSNDELIKTAEVRELNGADEEVIARVANNSPVKLFKSILDRGVVKVGDQQANQKILSGLTVGDVDALLLAIRYATYGEVLELEVTCPSCKGQFHLDLNLPKSIPVKELEGDSIAFEVKLRKDKVATVRLATYADQLEILDGKDRTVAEVNSLLLASVVSTIDGMSVTISDIRQLGIADRKTLVDAIAERTPGPQLEKVKQSCPECSEDIPLPLSMADLFQVS